MKTLTNKDSWIVYIDGSYHPRKKIGSWAYLYYNEKSPLNVYCQSGVIQDMITSPLSAEIISLISFLEDFDLCTFLFNRFKILTDCKILVDVFGKFESWNENNQGKKKNEQNILLKHLYALQKEKSLDIVWVKGHNGNMFNEMVDNMARLTNTYRHGIDLVEFKMIDLFHQTFDKRERFISLLFGKVADTAICSRL